MGAFSRWIKARLDAQQAEREAEQIATVKNWQRLRRTCIPMHSIIPGSTPEHLYERQVVVNRVDRIVYFEEGGIVRGISLDELPPGLASCFVEGFEI